MQSKFLSLKVIDFIKGAVVSALTAGLTAISQQLDVGHIPTSSEGKVIGITAAASFIGYLVKNLFTNSSGTIGSEKK
jgi:hypothetical protein